jgi:hypothetical protein
LIEHRDSGLLDLRFGDQIGAGGNVVQQVKFGENEGAGILSAEKFSCRASCPTRLLNPVENAENNERFEFVEALVRGHFIDRFMLLWLTFYFPDQCSDRTVEC